MTEGLAGLLLYLLVVVGVVALAMVMLLSMCAHWLLARITDFRPKAQEALLWLTAVMPWGIGAYAAALTQISSLGHKLGLAPNHCYHHAGAPLPHLCFYHPLAFDWASWQGLFLLVAAVIVIGKITQGFYRAYEHQRHVRMILSFAQRRCEGIYLLDSDIPNAFTAGLFSPQVVLSHALKQALTQQECTVVLQHELAHKRARDPLRLWLFAVAVSFYPPRVRNALTQAMEIALEKVADAQVLALQKDARLVASTLIKVSRLTQRFFTQQSAPDLCHLGRTAIEQRVVYLLAADKGRAFPGFVLALCISVLLVAGVHSADLIHHGVESLF